MLSFISAYFLSSSWLFFSSSSSFPFHIPLIFFPHPFNKFLPTCYSYSLFLLLISPLLATNFSLPCYSFSLLLLLNLSFPAPLLILSCSYSFSLFMLLIFLNLLATHFPSSSYSFSLFSCPRWFPPWPACLWWN